MNKVITISRQYGSGGREVGQKLADHYGIPFYDNEIISHAAKESGFSEVAFERAEEKATNSFLYSLAMGMSAYGNMDMGFSAGIGENSIESRSDICADMEFLGIRLDNEKNTVRGEERAVHADDARVQVWVVPTNEELSIAEDVVKLVDPGDSDAF